MNEMKDLLCYDQPTVHFLVGVPGSGKSTWAEKAFDFLRQHNRQAVLLSTDSYINAFAQFEGKTYNEVFVDSISKAEKLVREDAHAAFADGADVIWDQTNTSPKTRKKKLAIIPRGYRVVAHIFPTPPNELHARVLDAPSRGKVIPGHTVSEMKKKFDQDPPRLSEGFDRVLIHAPWWNEREPEKPKTVQVELDSQELGALVALLGMTSAQFDHAVGIDTQKSSSLYFRLVQRLNELGAYPPHLIGWKLEKSNGFNPTT